MLRGNPYFFWIVTRRRSRQTSLFDARPIARVQYQGKRIAKVAFTAPERAVRPCK